jgi:hypothetical protein
MLAAWVDGGLTSNEVKQAELHVSTCARCQAMVAATMTSAPISASGAEEQPVRRWGFGWLVPVAAGVAAVGLWFMVPSRTPFNDAPVPAPAVASAPPQASGIAPSQQAETAPPLDRRQAAQAPVEQPSALRDRRAFDSADARLAEQERRAGAPAAVPNESPKLEPTIVQRADEMIAAAREEPAAKAAAESAAAKDAVTPRPAAPPASAPARAIASGMSAPPAAAPGASLSAVAADRSANVQTPGVEVVSPTASIRWRLGPGGMVQRTSDAGATWTQQSVGVPVDLLAGSSPSPDVCWIVGRAGTVLRTVDGGRQWQKTTVVGGFDLQSVTATDASTAVVTAADGRVFRTVDAGMTWR